MDINISINIDYNFYNNGNYKKIDYNIILKKIYNFFLKREILNTLYINKPLIKNYYNISNNEGILLIIGFFLIIIAAIWTIIYSFKIIYYIWNKGYNGKTIYYRKNKI